MNAVEGGQVYSSEKVKWERERECVDVLSDKCCKG